MATEPSTPNLQLLEQQAKLIQQAKRVLLPFRFEPLLRQPLFCSESLPKFASTGTGCVIGDSLGRQLIDWTGGISSNLLGHRHPLLLQTMQAWIDDAPPHPLDPPASCDGPLTDPREPRLAVRLAELFGGQDYGVSFTRGRREAIYSATEMARTLAGKEIILVPELNTSREWFAEDQRFRFARPQFDSAHVKTFQADNVGSLRWNLNQHKGSVAAVVMEPFAFHFPDRDYWPEVTQLLREHGVLLIFDESQTAFRLETGSAQKYFSIQPDITIAGENLGGAMSFSALIGRWEKLKTSWRSTIRNIDRPSGLTLDLVAATLDKVEKENLPGQFHRIGTQLSEEFNDIASQAEIGACLIGHPSRLSLDFVPHDFLTIEQRRTVFSMFAAENGIMTHGEFWPNAAHDDQAIDLTIRKLEKTVEAFAIWLKQVHEESVSIQHPWRKAAVRGRIDNVMMIRKTMVLAGWILVDGQAVTLKATNEAGDQSVADVVDRPDLVNGFPQYPSAGQSGFRIELEVESIKRNSRFVLDAYVQDRLVYRTLLVHEALKQRSGPWPFTDDAIFA